MLYRCEKCGTHQWRGLFPNPDHWLRYAVLHGIALGISASLTRLLFRFFGYEIEGWQIGLASLAVCAVLMLAVYCVAMLAETCLVRSCRCIKCGARELLFTDGEDSP